MTRISDIVSNAVEELQGLLEEIESSEEDDLKEIAGTFDKLAEKADGVANTLFKADEALGGGAEAGSGEQPSGEDEGEEPELEGDEEEPPRKTASKKRSTKKR